MSFINILLEAEQKYSSADTSLNQVPGLHKKLAADYDLILSEFKNVIDSDNYKNFILNNYSDPYVETNLDIDQVILNFDNGAGKYTKASEYLNDNGFLNLRYDPYNISDSSLVKMVSKFKGKCITSTIANVLNVIEEDDVIIDVLEKSREMLRSGGKVYISTYEGDRSGVGAETPKGYQRNTKTRDYLPLVEKVFDDAIVSKGIIIGTK